MVARSIRRYCKECGEPVYKVIDNRNKTIWEQDHECDPKKRVLWKVQGQEELLNEVSKNMSREHDLGPPTRTKNRPNYFCRKCKNCGQEFFYKNDLKAYHNYHSFTYGCPGKMKKEEKENGV